MPVDESKFAELIFDHYVRLFSSPKYRKVFSPSDNVPSIQVLLFDNVFPRCETFCTLGYGRFSLKTIGVFQEVILSIDGNSDGVPELLSKCLYAMANLDVPLERGISVGGLHKYSPAFVERTGKPALFFILPFLLPEKFEHPHNVDCQAEMIMAVPISEAEHQYLKCKGSDELEDRLIENEVDPFNVMRSSVV